MKKQQLLIKAQNSLLNSSKYLFSWLIEFCFFNIKIAKEYNYFIHRLNIIRSGPEVPPFNYNGFIAKITISPITTEAPSTTSTPTTSTVPTSTLTAENTGS